MVGFQQFQIFEGLLGANNQARQRMAETETKNHKFAKLRDFHFTHTLGFS